MTNKEYQKQWYLANKDRILQKRKSRYNLKKEDPEFVEKMRENSRNWRKKYPLKRKKQKARLAKKWRQNPQYRLKRQLSKYLINGIQRCDGVKEYKTINYIGCTYLELYQHLENQFEPWMNWNNWGPYDKNRKTWHVDHIKPKSKFDHSKEDEIRKCWHYSNLRPLLAIENMKKGDSWADDHLCEEESILF